MDAAKSEKAKAGRVTMPKVFFVIGIIGFVLLATATFLCGRIPHMIGIAAGFAILALPDLALIIAYFNQRIYYTDEMFVHKNFWGIKRLYRYEDITGIRIDGDVNLFWESGKSAFMTGQSERKNLFAMRERDTIAYMIKVSRWCREKERYIQRQHKNPGEAIAVGIILIGGMALIYWIFLYGMWALTAKTQDELTVSTVAFNHCEIQDDAIRLYGDGEKCYIIPKYKSIMPDADEFLDEYQNGGTLILGYAKVYANEDVYVYTAESNDGRIFVTFEKSDALQKERFIQRWKVMPKPITALMIFFPTVMLMFVAAGFYVGRHVEKFSPKTVHIFYQNSNINWPNSKKKPSAKKRKKRK